MGEKSRPGNLVIFRHVSCEKKYSDISARIKLVGARFLSIAMIFRVVIITK